MKSLRLHKYTDRLLGLSYDELLVLTEADLQHMVSLRAMRAHTQEMGT